MQVLPLDKTNGSFQVPAESSTAPAVAVRPGASVYCGGGRGSLQPEQREPNGDVKMKTSPAAEELLGRGVIAVLGFSDSIDGDGSSVIEPHPISRFVPGLWALRGKTPCGFHEN